jgi:hypothetical protein
MSGRNIFGGEPMALRVMVTIDFGDEMHSPLALYGNAVYDFRAAHCTQLSLFVARA